MKATNKNSGLPRYLPLGPLEYDDEDPQAETAVNPTVVFEALSPSTEAYDRIEFPSTNLPPRPKASEA